MSPAVAKSGGRAFRPRPEDPFAWLGLVVAEGPFLSRAGLKKEYAEGLPRPDDVVDSFRDTFRTEFPIWEKAWTKRLRSSGDAQVARYLKARDEWVQAFVSEGLGWGKYHTTEGADTVRASSLDGQVSVTATGFLEVEGSRAALLLVVNPTEDLAAPGSDGWTANAVDRAAALLRASGDGDAERIPVALVTDGRWWAIVWTSKSGSTGSGIFDGALFREEPGLRDAFWALVRFTSLAGGAVRRRLPALLGESLTSVEEITDALGSQVRAAVEQLVQSFSSSHLHALDRGQASPLPADSHEVYETAVTVMMRVVFLLFAEANDLLPTDQLYRDAYAISGAGKSLDDRRRHAVGIEGDEALASTFDTWHRMLATSRALFEGATFEDLRMPAYGGSLFDPDRYAWLTEIDPLTGGLQVRVDDLVMFHVLRSVQFAVVGKEERPVSFRELDVEQIGYVYEGLLGYSARYVDEVVVGLEGKESERGSEPEVPLEVLHELYERVSDDAAACARALIEWVEKDQPAAKPRTVRQLAKAFSASAEPDVQDGARRQLRAVVGDEELVEALVGYYCLIRHDLRGLPYVAPAGGLIVVETRSRATSGTHYTPRSLAEDVVHQALEPLVFEPGPLQTADTKQWVPISSTDILELKVADIAAGSGAFLVAAARYLADRLLEAWDREGITRGDVDASSRQRWLVEAIREVIAHCLYGVDINPMAVEMCKLSLWLVSLDPAKPFSFVDDKILCGNSLLGLTELRQLRGLHIAPSAARLANPGFTVDVDSAIDRATELRHRLASPVTDTDVMRSTRAKRALLAQLDENNAILRLVADGIVAAGMQLGGKPGKDLDAKYEALSLALLRAFPERGDADQGNLDGVLTRGLTPTVPTDYRRWQPLHWIVEFPDVLVEHRGFDAIIGNPPFLGGQKLTGALGDNVRDWFVNRIAGGTKGSADLVAYFFLRAQSLIRRDCGQLGLIATNTIAQGDSREVGLDQMVKRGLTIRRSVQTASWPARGANLEYAAVWGSMSMPAEGSELVSDGVVVRAISSLLEPEGWVSGSPKRLVENKSIAFQGSIVLGKGFILDREQARRMIEADPRNSDVICPYLNGEDLNSRPASDARRWVLNFFDWREERAADYEAPYRWVRERVRPERMRKSASGDFVLRKPLPQRWWHYAEKRPGLYASVAGLDEVLAIARVSKTVMPLRVPAGQVISDAAVVFTSDSFVDQAVLSSSLHQAWAIKYGSGMRNDPRYTPSDVFETFARPAHSSELQRIGVALDEERREMMLRRNLGLTKLYNLVNDPDVFGDADVRRLREIHMKVDEAVVVAYGWDDVPLDHGFHTYRQMERFTFSPAARIELLDRLLEENHRRAELQGAGLDFTEDDDHVDSNDDVETDA